jgi:hypothetical protein
MEPAMAVSVNGLLMGVSQTAYSRATGAHPQGTKMGQIFRSDRSVFSPRSSAADPPTMAERVMAFKPATDAEALKLLRASFPDCPLSVRVAALDFVMRRRTRVSAAL